MSIDYMAGCTIADDILYYAYFFKDTIHGFLLGF